MTVTPPNFLIIGAQKAASTAMLSALSMHPEVWIPSWEDPFLRDPVFDPAGTDSFLETYRRRPERAVGLKCPDYFARPEVPARIREVLGRPKLVLVVRNPVARAVSAYYWHVRWGALPVVEPNDGMRRLLAGEYATTDPTSNEILDWGLYGQHLDRYLEYFDLADILIVHDADLRNRRAEALAEVTQFLGISEATEPMLQTSPTNEGVYDSRRLKFLQLRNGVILKWNADRSYYTIFKPRNAILRGYSNVIAAVDSWVLSRVFGNEKPQIAEDVASALRRFYAVDSAHFQQTIGRSLPGWPADGEVEGVSSVG